MKKAIVLLLALAVFGVFAFADDAMAAPALVLSGSVQVGTQFGYDKTSDLTYLQNWSSNDGDNMSFYLDGVFAGTNAGGKFELLTKAAADGTNPVKIDTGFGWWKPIAMLTLQAGYNYGSLYATPIEGWANGGTGAQIALKPIDGLTIGLDLDATAGMTKFDASAQIGFDFQYVLKDIATVGFDYDLGSNYFVAGANVVAVPNLTAQVDVRYAVKAGATAAAADWNYVKNTLKAEQNFAYAMGALKPSLWLAESKVDTADLTWSVKPGVAYTAGAYTPSAYFEYDYASTAATWSLGAALDTTVEKNAVHVYADYKSAGSYDLGLRYIVSF